MLTSFLITFREGLEAFLLVGVILVHLAKLDARRYFRYIYLGVAAGLVVSFVAAVMFQVVVDQFHQQQYRQIFMAVIMLTAAAVLTYMVTWMSRQAGRKVSQVHEDLSQLVSGGDVLGLSLLAFVSIAREGLETVLFFSALTYSGGAGGLQGSVTGALIGLVAAVALVWVVFSRARKVPLQPLFRYTSLLLIVIAAGLLASATNILQAAEVLPLFQGQLFDLSGVLSDQGPFGMFLRGLFGYNATPTTAQFAVWAVYLAVFLVIWQRSYRHAQHG
ncbi:MULTISPECIES: FTR1 family protein [unclassified Modicisalibacter]|uniref:FTR1 family iron permease n=1 Tax=unclassified Modicisalibacter TaxID=2679913 RepID=UPI001CC9B52B|nr:MULTISPECIES: FTR1 family protein [unclassified Modicisalibacter]MBZ9560113.1 FTR1 family protein [Modicisalibacter sp. R2A 31.J]MBZ9576021.1 FTR1 family protein [Modicisalibacter sp. MOD 31.J]